MGDHTEADDALLEQLRRQGLDVGQQRFAAFCVAHRYLLTFTEQLRQHSLVSVVHLVTRDER
ncbi:hypothetical protein [Pseudomonas bohemica]|uniref:hypothetical protein n=1 Tax=Pseudomonas bohemica TaxID=2044872 RepID=UPI000DA62075|nr:hypothetical protein [Pseudomonas bohemica]